MKRFFIFCIIALNLFALPTKAEELTIDTDGDGYTDEIEIQNGFDPLDPRPIKITPTAVMLPVPFTTQAPFAQWGKQPWEDACEEASAIMFAAFLNKETAFTPTEANKKILSAVAWEKQTYGFHRDTNAQLTARLLRDHFNIPQASVTHEVNEEHIKKELQAGHPVLLPIHGKLLRNPYYRGTVGYHMILIKGYDKEGNFIIHDPGTRHGANLKFTSTILLDAVHDWNRGDVARGEKVMITLQEIK